jgi:formylglycine-generating enzyme required for sulfatase activity
VGQKQPNAFGLYDTLGNVWEWCLDGSGGYADGFQTAPTGSAANTARMIRVGRGWKMVNPNSSSSSSNRVFRGGCWLNVAKEVRSANRNKFLPSRFISLIGFRLASSTAGV